jgi:hypothetical protein
MQTKLKGAISFIFCTLLLMPVATVESAWKTLGVGEVLGDCSGYDKECSKTIKTRYGDLSIRTTGDIDFSVQVNGKQVKAVSGHSLTVQEIHSLGQADVALVAVNSGGMACPMELFIVQTSDESAIVSDSFGTCSDFYESHIEGSALVIRMPDYFNPMHLDELSEKERESLNNERISVFEWSGSVLSERTQSK